jgi:hypothetical protein
MTGVTWMQVYCLNRVCSVWGADFKINVEENYIWYVCGWGKWISSIVLSVVEGIDSVGKYLVKFDVDNMMAALG